MAYPLPLLPARRSQADKSAPSPPVLTTTYTGTFPSSFFFSFSLGPRWEERLRLGEWGCLFPPPFQVVVERQQFFFFFFPLLLL